MIDFELARRELELSAANLPHRPLPTRTCAATPRIASQRAVVVYGLGGAGKSELILQYARAHRDSYQLIWWVTAASAAQDQAGPGPGRQGLRVARQPGLAPTNPGADFRRAVGNRSGSGYILGL
jgi:hypothetical protein